MQDIELALLENYNITAKKIKRIEYGLWEKNYKVHTQNEVFFVKQFWGTWRLKEKYNDMLRGIILSQEMRRSGLPVPVHINDIYNNMLSKHGDHTYQVNEWINGKTYRPGVVPNEVAFSMGKLLGELHLKLNDNFTESVVEPICLTDSITRKKELIDLLTNESFEDKEEIIEVLRRQLRCLENHTISDFKMKSKVGRVYNSYWIEQLLFDETHQVIGLIDWTDGAGGTGNIIDDIDTAYFISAFDFDGILSFAKGYQTAHPLSEQEWKSIIEHSCTRHLDSNWIYHNWHKGRENRFEHWKSIARKWIYGIEYRLDNKEKIWMSIKSELVFTEEYNV